MDIEIIGRHVRVTDDLKRYASEKAERVAKYLKQGVRVEVILDHGSDQYSAEMIVSGHRGPAIVAHVTHQDFRSAVDITIDKLEHQLRKLKGRRKDHRGESMAGERTGLEPPPEPGDEAQPGDVIGDDLESPERTS